MSILAVYTNKPLASFQEGRTYCLSEVSKMTRKTGRDQQSPIQNIQCRILRTINKLPLVYIALSSRQSSEDSEEWLHCMLFLLGPDRFQVEEHNHVEVGMELGHRNQCASVGSTHLWANWFCPHEFHPQGSRKHPCDPHRWVGLSENLVASLSQLIFSVLYGY